MPERFTPLLRKLTGLFAKSKHPQANNQPTHKLDKAIPETPDKPKVPDVNDPQIQEKIREGVMGVVDSFDQHIQDQVPENVRTLIHQIQALIHQNTSNIAFSAEITHQPWIEMHPIRLDDLTGTLDFEENVEKNTPPYSLSVVMHRSPMGNYQDKIKVMWAEDNKVHEISLYKYPQLEVHSGYSLQNTYMVADFLQRRTALPSSLQNLRKDSGVQEELVTSANSFLAALLPEDSIPMSVKSNVQETTTKDETDKNSVILKANPTDRGKIIYTDEKFSEVSFENRYNPPEEGEEEMRVRKITDEAFVYVDKRGNEIPFVEIDMQIYLGSWGWFNMKYLYPKGGNFYSRKPHDEEIRTGNTKQALFSMRDSLNKLFQGFDTPEQAREKLGRFETITVFETHGYGSKFILAGGPDHVDIGPAAEVIDAYRAVQATRNQLPERFALIGCNGQGTKLIPASLPSEQPWVLDYATDVIDIIHSGPVEWNSQTGETVSIA